MLPMKPFWLWRLTGWFAKIRNKTVGTMQSYSWNPEMQWLFNILYMQLFNSLASGIFQFIFRRVIFKLMPPSHCREFGLRTNTNWHSLRIAQHRIDSNYFALVRCHFRISSQANTNVLKCSKHSYWPCESKPILLSRIALPNVVSIRVSSYWFVSHRCTFVSIRCTFAPGFAACLLRLSTLQYDAQRPHCRIGSHTFSLVRVSSY